MGGREQSSDATRGGAFRDGDSKPRDARNAVVLPISGDAPATGLFVVIPAYNEAAVIGHVVRELREQDLHIVVVDDASSDGTAAEAAHAGATVLRHALNRGQGAALQTGIAYALREGATILVTFDADGQHRSEEIADLVAPVAEGRVDIVLGSRFLGGTEDMPIARRVLLRLAVLFTRLHSRARLTDTHNGFRVLSRRAARRIHITQDRMAHASELIDQIVASGLDYVEMPVHVRYTEYSRSKGQRASGALRIVADYLLGDLAR